MKRRSRNRIAAARTARSREVAERGLLRCAIGRQGENKKRRSGVTGPLSSSASTGAARAAGRGSATARHGARRGHRRTGQRPSRRPRPCAPRSCRPAARHARPQASRSRFSPRPRRARPCRCDPARGSGSASESAPSFRERVLETDAYAAWLGAFRGSAGAILILGTGSCGFTVVDGKPTYVGGWGFEVSDEGSGAAIGREALRRALWVLRRTRSLVSALPSISSPIRPRSARPSSPLPERRRRPSSPASRPSCSTMPDASDALAVPRRGGGHGCAAHRLAPSRSRCAGGLPARRLGRRAAALAAGKRQGASCRAALGRHGRSDPDGSARRELERALTTARRQSICWDLVGSRLSGAADPSWAFPAARTPPLRRSASLSAPNISTAG